MHVMLDDLSQHILDIAENSLAAGASRVDVRLVEEDDKGFRVLEIRDNGKGMDAEMVRRVTDPFVTSRTTRRVGLGIPFLKQAAELAGGSFSIESVPGSGTCLRAVFRAGSIDCPPLGDLPATVVTLFVGYPDIRWVFRFSRRERSFEVDQKDILEIIEDPELMRTPPVASWLRDFVREGLEEMRMGGEVRAQSNESGGSSEDQGTGERSHIRPL
jgi:hypothetical protein